MEGFEPAVFSRPPKGVDDVVVLNTHEGKPDLKVRLVRPDWLSQARAESAASLALQAIVSSINRTDEYGIADKTFEEGDLPALARLLTAVEAAAHHWKAWNYAEDVKVGDTPPGQILPLTRANIFRCLTDPQVRQLWMAYFDSVSGLERAEGNGSAASPNGTTARAATTAEDAQNETFHAVVGSEDELASSARGSSTNLNP